MTEPTITCPKCHAEIKLTESLAAPLLETTRHDYEERLAEKDQAMAGREAALQSKQAALDEAKSKFDDELASRLKTERVKIAGDEARKAKDLLGAAIEAKDVTLAELQTLLADRDEKLGAAQKVQAELLKKEREFNEQKREMDLTIETRITESLEQVREKATAEATQAVGLKLLEKETQIASMGRQIVDLKKKAEQGSQQLQGEAQELHLEALIRSKFPMDVVEPVPKGEFGGDTLHRVLSPSGSICGAILWESKRTRNWSDGWLSKLREDMRAAKADAALLVTQTLPKGVESFDLVDGIWVTDARCAIPVAIALRQSLIALASAKTSREGKTTKAELVYEYLIGPQFKHRVEAIVEKFSEMQSDLDKERKSITRIWAKREAQIRGVLDATSGMYGDLQGIAGQKMLEIEGLELPLIGHEPD